MSEEPVRTVTFCDERHKGVDDKMTSLEKAVALTCKKMATMNRILFGLLVAVITTLVAILVK